jgi:hypothetical protein
VRFDEKAISEDPPPNGVEVGEGRLAGIWLTGVEERGSCVETTACFGGDRVAEAEAGGPEGVETAEKAVTDGAWLRLGAGVLCI